jgi:hypothetical protein
MVKIIESSGKPFIEMLRDIFEEKIKDQRCPITNKQLRCVTVYGNGNKPDLSKLENFEADIVISCKVLSRSANFPMIGATLNLKAFTVSGRSAHTQIAIGRGLRIVQASDVEVKIIQLLFRLSLMNFLL